MLAPMIRIGITGHRPHRLKVPERRLAAHVRGVLTSLLKATQPRRQKGPALDIISPLAEGCDRIVAREALALKQQLTAILPFERRDYEKTFSDARTLTEFRSLWRTSHEKLVLSGLAHRAEASYVSVGMLTLARSDLIVTMWDGKPAQGRGGTPEILQNALEWDIPIIWISAVQDKPPLLLTASRRKNSPPDLSKAVRGARRLDTAAYRSLVAAVPQK